MSPGFRRALLDKKPHNAAVPQGLGSVHRPAAIGVGGIDFDTQFRRHLDGFKYQSFPLATGGLNPPVFEPESAAFAASGDLLAPRTDAVIAANEETALVVLMGGLWDEQSLNTCGATVSGFRADGSQAYGTLFP